MGAVRAVNYFSEEEDLGKNQKRTTVLSYPKYYPDNGGWVDVNTSFVASDDPNFDWMVTKGIYRLYVKADGTFRWSHCGDTVTQRLTGLGFWNAAGKISSIAQAIAMPIPTVVGDTITWNFVSGITYYIQCREDTVRDVLVMPQSVRNVLKTAKPGGWAEADAQVGLVYNADISGAHIPDNQETIEDIQITYGNVRYKIPKSLVTHQSYDPKRPELIWTKNKVLSGGKLIEAVPFAVLNSIDGDLQFNTSQIFQRGVSPGSYSGCKDNYVDDDNPTTTYDSTTTLNVCTYSNIQRAFIAFDCSGTIVVGSTINSCKLEIYSTYEDNYDANLIGAYRCLKPWVETSTTWNRWDHANSKEWGIAGAGNESDSGTYNSGDGSGYDSWTTPDDTKGLNGSGAWWDWGGSVGDAMAISLQAQLDNSQWQGWKLRYVSATSKEMNFAPSEYATSASRPKLTVDYTEPSGQPTMRRWGGVRYMNLSGRRGW